MHGTLITPEYLALQKDLHERFDYGWGGDSEECNQIVRGFDGIETVLDYGCGQGLLGRLLRPDYEVEEYDPAILGKDEESARADVVVCADVLEHVEPDCLSGVLLHLRALTKKYAVLIIATKPSKKIMADGRSAHLIVEDAGFWFQKLTGLFNFERFEDRSHIGKGLLIVVTPREGSFVLPIARIRSTTAVTNDERNENVRQNCKTIEARLPLKLHAHEKTAHLACFGPTLADTWPALAMAKARGEYVFTVSGAHDFLIERNIIPSVHMDCDPRPHKAEMITPNHAVAYWLASCISPKYIEKLADHDVSLWHSYNGKESEEAFRIDPGHQMIIGGGSIGLRAMSVLYCRGYRKFEIHGMDCSFKDDAHHADEHLGVNHKATPVLCGDRWFQANAVMLLYARYFHKQLQMMPDAKINLHGDGLLQHMMRESINV